MKKVPLKDDTKAFVYGPKEAVDKMPVEALQALQDFIGRPIVRLNVMLSEIFKREVEGIYIAFDTEGKCLQTLSTAEDIGKVRAVLEFTLEKIKEAQKREGN